MLPIRFVVGNKVLILWWCRNGIIFLPSSSGVLVYFFLLSFISFLLWTSVRCSFMVFGSSDVLLLYYIDVPSYLDQWMYHYFTTSLFRFIGSLDVPFLYYVGVSKLFGLWFIGCTVFVLRWYSKLFEFLVFRRTVIILRRCTSSIFCYNWRSPRLLSTKMP